MKKANSFEQLLADVRACRLCADHLPLGPRPILRVNPTAKLLIVGQAPGTRVHNSGVPWNDPSGDRLRQWLELDRTQFYDETRIAILPTGLCYPGKGKSGDLPPRPECAPLWHPPLLEHLPEIQLTLLIGGYAQAYYLGAARKKDLTATVAAAAEYLPRFLPLPHPSPRNQLWLKKNAWFAERILPLLRRELKRLAD